LQRLHGGHEGRVIGVGRLVDRQVVLKSQLPHRGEPDIFLGVVAMGDHRNDLVTQFPAELNEGLQAGVADIVVTHEDDAQSVILILGGINIYIWIDPDWAVRSYLGHVDSL